MEDQIDTKSEAEAEIAGLRQRIAELEQEVEHQKSLYAMVRLMCDNVPDLIWAKDLDRKFLFVNKAMCQKLLGAADTSEPIGRTDMFFAERERRAHADNPNWHTFGEICSDSDAVVMSTRKPARFEEFGNVKGQFLYLDVYKAPFWDEQGRMIGTVGCGRIVTEERKTAREREQAVQALQQRLALEELVTTISSRFINVPLTAIDTEIHQALHAIGEFTGVDRCYIHIFAANDVRIGESYEWYATGFGPREELMKGSSLEPFPWTLEKLRLLETIYVPAVDELPPEAHAEHRTWEAQGIRSILAIPLAVNHVLAGFFGLDIERKTERKTWSEEDVSLLRLMAEVFVNLLARKQAEATLAEQENFIKNVASASPNILYVYNRLANRTIYANRDIGETLGYNRGELIAAENDLFAALVHPDDLPRLSTHRQALEESQQGDIIELEYRMRDKAGNWRWLYNRELVFKWTETGKVAEILGTTQDITTRRETEEALRRYAKRLQALHEMDRSVLAARSPETIAATTLHHIQDLMPCRWAAIIEFGASKPTRLLAFFTDGHTSSDGAVTARLVETADLPVYRQAQLRVVQDMLALPRHDALEDILREQGVRAYVSVPFLVLGEVTGLLIVGTNSPGAFSPFALDLVEEVATSLALAIRHARLDEQTQQDAQTKTVLLQEVNHRVKNNLASIIGLLHLEQRRIGPEEITAPYQKTMASLINRVQGLATVHSLLSAAEWSPVPLSDLAYQVIESTAQALAYNRHVFINVSPSPVQVIPRQANSLALVINELATNTLKHGLVDMQATRISVSISLEAQSSVHFEFRDNGPGYPREVLDLAAVEASISVGLDLVQTIVRKELRGILLFANERGAVITIQFPLVQPDK